MTMWEQQIAAAHADYIDALEQRGFERTAPSYLDGTVDAAGGRRKITVVLHAGFPFVAPFVRARDVDLPRSWHVDPDDYLCLYTEDDYNSAPWRDVDAFLGRVAEWFDQANAGWPDDMPVLDAERYLHADDANILIVYDDLAPFIDGYARLHQESPRVIRLQTTGPPPTRRRQADRRRYARVADVGELAYPPRDWQDIRELLPDPDAVEQEIRDRKIKALLLAYTRQGHAGVIAVHTFPLNGGGIGTTAYQSASADRDATAYRSGPQRHVLADKRVLIVGAGAIGSFLADALSRSGLGQLTLRDGDILKPGNVVRHCGPARIGENKAEAVRDDLADRATETTADPRMLVDASEPPGLFADYNLVIDASANGTVTAMLGAAASTVGAHLLSVCVQNDGDTTRVDIIPPISGSPIPPTPQRPTQATTPFFEGGCGDPVSPTPPYAVIDAAALAARHAVALLADTPINPAGEVRDTRPTSGAP